MIAAEKSAPEVRGDMTDVTVTDAGETEQRCAVCTHAWTAHDAIAVRFCAATRDSDLSRGCICTDRSS